MQFGGAAGGVRLSGTNANRTMVNPKYDKLNSHEEDKIYFKK